ncbi:TPA: hypothetical protein ACK3RK_006073 [Burkholderia cepacia]
MDVLLAPESVRYIVAALLSAGSIYGAIRADLRWMRRSVSRAHQRIDDHLENHAK